MPFKFCKLLLFLQHHYGIAKRISSKPIIFYFFLLLILALKPKMEICDNSCVIFHWKFFFFKYPFFPKKIVFPRRERLKRNKVGLRKSTYKRFEIKPYTHEFTCIRGVFFFNKVRFPNMYKYKSCEKRNLNFYFHNYFIIFHNNVNSTILKSFTFLINWLFYFILLGLLVDVW
jgi:hypothetical protein